MTEAPKPTFLKGVDLFYKSNNTVHHTDEISSTQLIVRRGLPFIMTIKLNEAFNGKANPITITLQTGQFPSEELGTKTSFSIPYKDNPSSKAKMAWKVVVQKLSRDSKGKVSVMVTPPANCPIGKYNLFIKYKGKEGPLADMVVLFNPWCPDDSVYLLKEKKKQEYVLNEQGVVYIGSPCYIEPLHWDFGQFEEDMVDICLALLDNSLSYMEDPAKDVAARGDPIHVSRVLTAMVNSEDDPGVLEGNWSGDFCGGVSPSHWSGSHAILSQWYQECQRVRYGQCWVFACVMCSVMRLLGIPCRVVTNFASAHDVDRNLTIDTYHSCDGLCKRPSPDSVWNFHVWVEGWFDRPDLSDCGSFDGWQVLDPTPQETSGGIYRCGPAPVKAIRKGRTDLKYDIPFIFAEVNADCKDWKIVGENEDDLECIDSDTKRVGQSISTKSVGCNKRRDITSKYKPKEGSTEERTVFKCALKRDYSKVDEWEDHFPDSDTEEEDEEEEEEEVVPSKPACPAEPAKPPAPPPEVFLRFDEVTQPIDGGDVSMNLVVHSESKDTRELTINISVQAMLYNGVPKSKIFREQHQKKLLPGQDLIVPILVPYCVYHSHMVKSESMKIEALITDKGRTYLAAEDIVLMKPEIELNAPGEFRLCQRSMVEVVFENPLEQTLTNGIMTFCGSGLLRDEIEFKIPDLCPGMRVRVKLYFRPYRKGERTIVVDFDCSDFRDLKANKTVNVVV